MPDWKSDNIKELMAALQAAQDEFPTVAKNATNPFHNSRYATFKDDVAAIRPILSKHGLVVSQPPGGEVLNTILVHTPTGQWISGEMHLSTGGKTDAQALGSAITYAKRYSYEALLGITTGEEDDDGHAASAPAGAPVQERGQQPNTAAKVQEAAKRAQAQPPRQRGTTSGATPAQRNFIGALGGKDLGYDDKRLLEEVSTIAGAEVEQLSDLTSTQAKAVIEEFKARGKAKAQKPLPAGQEPFEDPPF